MKTSFMRILSENELSFNFWQWWMSLSSFDPLKKMKGEKRISGINFIGLSMMP